MAFILVLTMAAESAASVRVLTRARSDLRLFEKTGRMENLLDNPARLLGMQNVLVEQYTDIQINDVNPHDPVFDKNRQDERLGFSGQTVVPVLEHWAVNAGCDYSSQLIMTKSTSRLDGTYIQDGEKTFGKKYNAGLATDLLPDLAAGYAFQTGKTEGYAEYLSDLASPYRYFNDTGRVRHTVGVSQGPLDLAASLESGRYQGAYNGISEVDFSFSSFAVQARYVLGTLEGENLTVYAAYASQMLDQTLFVLGRSGYSLDIMNYRFEAGGYYMAPQETWEWAIGLEAAQEDGNVFDVGEYRWVGRQNTRLDVPALLAVEVLPSLHAWMEVVLTISRDSRQDISRAALSQAWGLSCPVDLLTFTLFATPEAEWQESSTQDGIRAWTLGLDIQARF